MMEEAEKRTTKEKLKDAGKVVAEKGKKNAATIGFAATGLVFGGPVGALLGGGVGWVVDRVRED